MIKRFIYYYIFMYLLYTKWGLKVMLHKTSKKIIAIFIFICFIVTNPIALANYNSVDIENVSDPQNLYNVKNKITKENELFNSNTGYSQIMIDNITGGFGLSFTVKNVGFQEITNIKINLEVTGNYIQIKSQKYINISSLKPDQKEDIKINLFGIGIGEPFFKNRVSISASAYNHKIVKKIAVISVFGPLVDLISVFTNEEDSCEGFILFSPEYSTYTYLIDKDGNIVHSWKSNSINSITCELLENGNLVRNCFSKINPSFLIGGATGRVEILNWDGDLIWEFEYSNDEHCLHHDIEVLPNGNILMIAWEIKTRDESIQAGRNPFLIPTGVLWPCYLIEVDPSLPDNDNIVWQWHVWDHLIQDYDEIMDNYGVISDHPELIDINYGVPFGLYDWNHMNSLDYNEELDQILMSSHIQNEIWIIDHSTTTEEAAGHTGGRYGKGGDLLYRWGNPQVYKTGSTDDQKLFGQHDARWIDKGCPGEDNILIFNNGFMQPGSFYSSVLEIEPPIDEKGNYRLNSDVPFSPNEPTWTYTSEEPTDFFSPIQSGCQRLENGNTIICSCHDGLLFEVNPDNNILWSYTNLYPNQLTNRVDKVNFYPPDYPGIGDFNNNNLINQPLIDQFFEFNFLQNLMNFLLKYSK